MEQLAALQLCMTESGAQKSSNENPSQTMTKKNAITLCIREGLKRRLGGVQQSQRQIAEEREEAPNVSFLAKKKEQIGDNESLENYLSTLPRLNPENRTLVWLLYNEEGEKEEVDEEELQSLPRRGTIEPRVISTPAFSTHGTEITSLSHCESARGTNGRGTPIPQDDSQPRLDELFKRFQEQQKRALKGHLKRCGNLTFIPASRRTHLNPLPQYMEITPDIIPFLATPPSRHKLDPIPLRENPQSSAAMKVKHTVTCHWLGCNHRFRNSNELYVHIEEDHLDSSHLDGEWVCQWRGCQDNIKLFSECYKLLLHIQMCHCKKSSRTIPHHRSVSDQVVINQMYIPLCL